jgi:hypothetical protein
MTNVLDSLVGTYGSTYDKEFSDIADILLEQGTLLYEEEETLAFVEGIVNCYEYQGKLYELWYHVQTPDTPYVDLQFGFNNTTNYWE